MAQPQSPARRWFRRLVWLLVCGVAAWVAGSWWAGNQLAHPPRRPLQDYHREFLSDPAAHGVSIRTFTAGTFNTPCVLVEPLPDGGLGTRGRRLREQLTEQGVRMEPSGVITGTLVLLHGRRGRKEDYLLIAERFAAVGFRSLIPDLPGHGDHPDPLTTYGIRECEIPAALLKEAGTRFGFDGSKAGLMGISMGGAVAIHTAARHPDFWSSVAVLSTFDTLENVVRFQAESLVSRALAPAWISGTRWVFEKQAGIPLSQIRSIDHLPMIKVPLLIGHGTADRGIPLKLGQNLRTSVPKSVSTEWVEIPGADHDNVLITDFPIYATMARWFLAHR